MNISSPTCIENTENEKYSYLTPEELLEHYISGDDTAFHILVENIGRQLLGFIVRYTGDYHIAEDIFQEVLLKVACNANSFNSRSRLNPWLYRIARNTTIDALKKLNKHKQYLQEFNDNDNYDEEVDRRVLKALCNNLPPVETITVEELGRRISAAVTSLPEPQREVFLLREDADLTFEEIAKITGTSKETAKSRMRYAVNKLRTNLKKEAKLYGLLDRL